MKLIVSNNWFHTESHVADDAAWPIMLSVFFAMNGKANKMHLSYRLHTQYISSSLLVSFQTACGKCIFSRAWRCITRATTQVMHRRLMRATAGLASLMLDSVRIHYACTCHPNSWMSMKQSRTFKHLHQPAVLRPVQHVTNMCILTLYMA